MVDKRLNQGRKRGRRATLTPEEKLKRERERWRSKQARKRKRKRDAERLRRTNFGYFVELWVPHYHSLTKALVAAGFLREDDVDISDRVDEAAEELFQSIPSEDWERRAGWDPFATEFGSGPRLSRAKQGTTRIMMTADLADRLVADGAEVEFERSRPGPQPDRRLIRQYRRAQAHEQKCWALFGRSKPGPERVEANKLLDRAREDCYRLRNEINAISAPPAFDKDEFAKFAKGLLENRHFLRRTAEQILFKWYSSYDFSQQPMPCNCNLALAACACAWGPRAKLAAGPLATPPRPARPRAGKLLVRRDLYSGRKPRWWGERNYSGSKRNDDEIVRSHDKSASVGMKGFHAGTKGTWKNDQAIYYPEQDDRAWARDWDKTAREGEKALQRPFDDPEGTPKSWSNPADADPGDDKHITRIGTREIEETLIEPAKDKDEK
jgi:hypothetical protein